MQRIDSGRSALRALSLILPLGLLASLAVPTAKAQVYTDPVGFITLTAVGSATPPVYSFQALGMTQLPVSRGNATAVSANKVGVNTTLTPGQFNFSADGYPTHYIEITSGPMAGVFDDIVSNDTANVFTVTDLTSAIGGGATYKIYPHWTIGKVFGPNNEAGLLGGTSAATADNVAVWNPIAQAFTTYYYKTGGLGGTGWRNTASTSINRTNATLYIDQGFQIIRRTTGTLTNKLVGAVKLGPTITLVVGASGGSKYTFAANVYPTAIPLGASGLYTTNSATGLNGGTSAATADTISIWNPDTQAFTTYYFKTGGLGGTGWRSTASTSVDASTNTIPLGTFGYIERKVAGDFNWKMPQLFTP